MVGLKNLLWKYLNSSSLLDRQIKLDSNLLFSVEYLRALPMSSLFDRLEGADGVALLLRLFRVSLTLLVRGTADVGADTVTPVVNFINILRTNFSYKHSFGSFSLVTCTYKKLPKWRLYKKFVCKMLMKLTAGLRGLECRTANWRTSLTPRKWNDWLGWPLAEIRLNKVLIRFVYK